MIRIWNTLMKVHPIQCQTAIRKKLLGYWLLNSYNFIFYKNAFEKINNQQKYQ